MGDVLEIARGYVSAGLSVIPVRANGTKAPLHAGWREYATRRPTDAELVAWFHPDIVCGVGIPGGAASGNLAVLDFETWAAYEVWLRALPPASQQLTRPCPLVKAPRGGAHLYVRLTDPVPGTVLARHLVDGSSRTLIEVRGDGEQVVAPGSPAECHPTGREYEWLRRGWLDAPVTAEPLPLDEWFTLIEAAAALNQIEHKPEPPPPAAPKPRAAAAGVKPGDDFNARGTLAETGLFDAGWSWFTEIDSDRGFLIRPGKKRSEGKSATFGLVTAKDGGHRLFYAFTTDCHPFESKKGYSLFRLYAILNHTSGGTTDYEAAARELGRKGYGDQSRGRGPAATFTGGANMAGAGNAGAESPPPQPAPPGAKPPLPIVYYSDVKPALDAADFVEGLLIDGAMTVIYGESGCGKTFFTLDLAMHTAGGLKWRGRDVDRRGVLYLALEGSYGISNRIAAFKLATGHTSLPFAHVPVSIDLLDPAGDTLRVIEAAKIAAATLNVPVGLIVVDTLSRAIAGGNENASEDMGALVRNVDLIRQALPAHVAIVHHSGKDGARGARGHSLLRAATDTEIEVSREPSGNVTVAKVTKQRELELGDEFAFTLASVQLGRNRRGKWVTSCVVQPAALDGTTSKEDRATAADREKRAKEREREAADERAVLLVIDAEANTGLPGASMSRIEDRVDCSKARARGAVERLLERGELVRVGPFKRPSGNGAMIDVKEGVGRPPKADRLF